MRDAGRRPADPHPASARSKQRPAARTAAAPQRPPAGTVQILRDLQRTAGNQAVNLLLRRKVARRVLPRTTQTLDWRQTRIEIDSDGDQRNDLLLELSISRHLTDMGVTLAPPTFTARITQLASQASQTLEFDWPNVNAEFLPSVLAVSDGKSPTAILLTPNANQELLLIYPPTLGDDGLQYRAEAAGKSATFALAGTVGGSGIGQQVATAGAVSTTPGFLEVVEVTLGAYGDQFRVTVQALAPDRALFGITAVRESAARGSMPVEIALRGPLSLHVVETGPVSLGLDLDGDDKPELQLFDQLDSPFDDAAEWVGPRENRYHRVRATGPALRADVIFPFTIRGDAVTSAMLAIGGITAVDVPLGPFGDMFRLTFQPTAPDRALFGISASEPGSLAEAKGQEIALSGPLSVQLIDIGPTGVGVDLNGDHKPEMQIVDQVDYKETEDFVGTDDVRRTHEVHIAGPAVGAGATFTFLNRSRLIGGSENPAEADKTAAANAMAVATLAQQAGQGSIQQQIDTYEYALAATRAKAAKQGIIPQQTYDAWLALSGDLIALQPQINHQKTFNFWAAASRGSAELQRQVQLHSVDSGLRDAAATHAAAFVAALEQAPAEAESPDSFLAWLGDDIAPEIRAGQWDDALTSYQALTTALDGRIIRKLDTKERSDAESLTAHRDALRDVAQHNPQRLLADFLPDEKFIHEQQFVTEVPLSLYYWREEPSKPTEASTWHLKDVTNPHDTHDYTVTEPAHTDETVPPDSLWRKLDDSDRFPLGLIRYVLPNGASGEVRVKDHLTWKKFLSYLGMALAVAAAVVAPFDAPVAVAALRLTAGAALATSAGIDLKEHIQKGDLGLTTALLDIGQIVGAVAGNLALNANILRTATIRLAAEEAIDAAAAAQLAAFAGKVYVPLVTVATAADTITFATFGIETAVQLAEIEFGPGSRADKDHAEYRLLAQLAAAGGLSALHIKGLSSPPGEGGILTVRLPEGGGPPVAEFAGEKAVTASGAAVPELDPETGLPFGTAPSAVGEAPVPSGSGGSLAPGARGTPGGPRRPSVLIVGAERVEEFDQAAALASQGRDVTVVNPRVTEAASSYQAGGGRFHEGGIESLPEGLQYDYIREEFPQPLGRTHVALRAVQARFRRLAPGGRLEIVAEANADEFLQVFEAIGESEYHCTVTRRELAPQEGPHSPAYVPAGERRIELVFVRPAAAPAAPVVEPPGAAQGPNPDPHAPAPAVAAPPAPAAPAPPAAAYDPAARTDDELVQDMTRTPRPGETADEAVARARAAAQALSIRQTMHTYRGLGEDPPILEMRAHDARNEALGAHTIERHGPDVALRRADAPPGIRTIEGRIYGDPPWNGATNWSYRWRSSSVMNDTINTYLRANWEAIRSELALDGTFEATFNVGNAVGEGFSNEGQMGMGPQNAVYHQTSFVTVTLQLIPGSPPSFFVVRAFPAGRGY